MTLVGWNTCPGLHTKDTDQIHMENMACTIIDLHSRVISMPPDEVLINKNIELIFPGLMDTFVSLEVGVLVIPSYGSIPVVG